MTSDNTTAVSKFLAYVLRHNPAAIGITLDGAGWVAIDTLTTAAARHGRHLDILRIDAAGMHAAGREFFRAANGVWLTAHVPPSFISFISR